MSTEILGGTPHELGPIRHPQFLCGVSAVVEEVLRDVAEDDATRLPNERHRTERDQPVTGADVEDHLPGLDASVLQHPVSDRPEELERPSLLLCIVGVAAREHPLGPLVPR
jgi:hypothetical protein